MLATLVLAATLLTSDDALRAYGVLLAHSRFGTVEQEEAGFLIEDDDGRLRLLRWHSREAFRASYSGRAPKNTIAIVHTHPFWSVEPSEHDRREARRIGLPIIVVTRDAVIAAGPDGTITPLAGAHWARRPVPSRGPARSPGAGVSTAAARKSSETTTTRVTGRNRFGSAAAASDRMGPVRHRPPARR